MTTQVQIQGETDTVQEARTLVSRVLDINTTESRLCVHNGSEPGGIPHVNYKDAQNNEYTYAVASGTNALTLTLTKPLNGWQAGQKIAVKIANNNTGSVTLNPDSIGAKTIKKLQDGALANLEADDLVAGVIYEFYYNGTDLQISSGLGGGGKWKYGSPISLTSGGGTTWDVLGIPANVEQLQIWIDNAEHAAGNATYTLTLGDSGGIETTNYIIRNTLIDASPNTIQNSNNATGIEMCTTNSLVSMRTFFEINIDLLSSANNLYSIKGSVFDVLFDFYNEFRGRKSLSSVMDRFRITNGSGTVNTDGTIRYRYR